VVDDPQSVSQLQEGLGVPPWWTVCTAADLRVVQ